MQTNIFLFSFYIYTSKLVFTLSLKKLSDSTSDSCFESVEIAFLNKKESEFDDKVYDHENVSDFPSTDMFYKSKYSILIKKTEV